MGWIMIHVLQSVSAYGEHTDDNLLIQEVSIVSIGQSHKTQPPQGMLGSWFLSSFLQQVGHGSERCWTRTIPAQSVRREFFGLPIQTVEIQNTCQEALKAILTTASVLGDPHVLQRIPEVRVDVESFHPRLHSGRIHRIHQRNPRRL